MGRPSDVVIGLDIGLRSIDGRAFSLDGAELGGAGQAFRPVGAEDGLVEVDAIQIWQAVVDVVHRLARAVPDLGRRTVAFGVTGRAGGLCLIDEDGEPVRPLASVGDEDGTRADGAGDAGLGERLFERITRRDAAAVDRAAYALDLQGWVLACLTGRPVRTPGMPGTAASLGEAAELARLTPPETALAAPLPLHAAAAATTGLWDETPVVVAPIAPVAAAVASGMTSAALDAGVALLEWETWLVRASGRRESGSTSGWPDLPTFDVRQGDIGGAALEWLVDLAQGLLADAGLIGLTPADLRSLLERQAEAAAPADLRLRKAPAGAPGPWQLQGLSGSTCFADLARAVYGGIAHACRANLGAGGRMPAEVRAAGTLAAAPPGRTILPALFGAPTRILDRPAPAATGAALCALRAIGEIKSFTEGTADWVDRFLGPASQPASAVDQRYG